MNLQRLCYSLLLYALLLAGCNDRKKDQIEGRMGYPGVEGIARKHADAESLHSDKNYILTSNSSVKILAAGQRTDSHPYGRHLKGQFTVQWRLA